MTETDDNGMRPEIRRRLLDLTAMANEYCVTVENAAESELSEFLPSMLRLLPRIYLEFTDIVPGSPEGEGAGDEAGENEESAWDEYASVPLQDEEAVDADEIYYGSYIDEDYYNSVRRHIEQLFGPDDTFLETFEEDMKYSDTPLAASVSECLADIFQSLYNFVSIVRDSYGDAMEGAYRRCHEEFTSYWSQILCNVLRALNHIYYRQ